MVNDIPIPVRAKRANHCLSACLEVFEKYVLEDFAQYMHGSDDMPDDMPDGVFQRTAFLTPPVKVTYTSDEAWPNGIENKCLEYYQIVSGIFISVEQVKRRGKKKILDVTFREVVAPVILLEEEVPPQHFA